MRLAAFKHGSAWARLLESTGRDQQRRRSSRANDLVALGCYDVFHERGMHCPEDISVVGFNGMPFLDKMQPPLTTVSIPHYELGFEASHSIEDAVVDLIKAFKEGKLPDSLEDPRYFNIKMMQKANLQ